MIRPTIKDKSILEYVEYLEKQLVELKTHTKKKFYMGIQRQLDLLADEMLDPSFIVSMKKTDNDSGFDGFFDMITKGDAIIKAMEKFEAQALPKEEKSDVKKPLSEDSAENYLKK